VIPLVTLMLGAILGVVFQRRGYLGQAKRMVFNRFRRFRARNLSFANQRVDIEVRTFPTTSVSGPLLSEREGSYENRSISTTTAEIALILVDVWADHPVKGWQARAEANIEGMVLPLVNASREHGILVVHAAHGEAVHPLIKPQALDLVIQGSTEQAQLVSALNSRGIRYLLYAGYASNMCILGRPTGIFEMQKKGYDIIFVRDASIAIEAPEFLDQEVTHRVATFMIEANWGASTTVGQILAQLHRI
jgi:nicotinamidase-related amidase